MRKLKTIIPDNPATPHPGPLLRKEREFLRFQKQLHDNKIFCDIFMV
jgi:hypothetical protein